MTEGQKINCDSILETLKRRVEAGNVIGKDEWLDEAFRLNALLLDESKKLFELEQKVAQLKFSILQAQTKRNVAAAEMEVALSQTFYDMRLQDAKIDQVKEYIRIAKHQSETF